MENTENFIKSEMELAKEEMTEALKSLYPNIDEETLTSSIKVACDTGRSSGKGESSGLKIAAATLKKLAEMKRKEPEKTFLPNIPSKK